MEEFLVYAMMIGALGGADLPFWATSGRYGITPEAGAPLIAAGIASAPDTSGTFRLDWGVGAASHGGRDFLLTRADARLRYRSLSLDAGLHSRTPDYLASDPVLGSLSASAGHLGDAANARPMPGYTLRLEPVAIPFTSSRATLGGFWGDYVSTDQRYVRGAKLHRMNIDLGIRLSDRMSLDLELDHMALWGGVHPEYGTTYSGYGIGEYFRVITASHDAAPIPGSDVAHMIAGEQAGSQIARFAYSADAWRLVLQYDHPYDAFENFFGSNFPDGVYSASLSFAKQGSWIDAILFEHHEFSRDDYFHNGYYKDGFTHYSRPFVVPLLSISDGALTAEHVGISGNLFRKSPYRLMATLIGAKEFSFCLTGRIPVLDGLSAMYDIAFDLGPLLPESQAILLGILLYI